MSVRSLSSRRIAVAAAAGSLMLTLVACGGTSSTGDAGSGAAATAPAGGSAAPASPAAGKTPALPRPKISAGKGAAPTKLVITDDAVGTGAEAVAGSTVSVQYVGAAFTTGKEFDASWERGEPFQFVLGAGRVIAGWDQGVAGMKVGGRRTLIIPPDLGYGATGAPPAIEPNETLTFVVDLLAVG
jgi:peptidylprolyl isomerase